MLQLLQHYIQTHFDFRVVFVGLLMSIPIATCLYFMLRLVDSRSWWKQGQTKETIATLRKKGTAKVREIEKKLGTHVMKTLDMWLYIIGDGKTAVIDPFTFLVVSLSLGVFLLIFMLRVSGEPLLSLVFLVFGISLPFLILYIMYLRVTGKTRQVFMEFVDGYLQTYIEENKHVLLGFKRMRERCPQEMRSIVEYLNLRLSDGSPFEESIWVLADILKFGWSRDFVYIVISGKRGDTKSIEKPLTNLMLGLQGAKNTDMERKVTTRSVFLFMAVLTISIPFLMRLNMRFLKEAKRMYFATPEGINFISYGSLFIILSFIAAIIWARRGDRL